MRSPRPYFFQNAFYYAWMKEFPAKYTFFGHPQYLDIFIPKRYNEDWIIKH